MALDVIVVGVGSMGASACWHLARRGIRVLGLEQGPLPNPEASFIGATRAIRLSYTEHPNYVPLLHGAYARWEELGKICGEDFLQLTGALYLGPPDEELVSGARHSAETHGLAHTMHSHTELAARWPQFLLPENFVGLHEERAGYLYSERAVQGMVDEARRYGADLLSDQHVLDWSATDREVTVRTTDGEHHAEHLVLTAGAWTSPLLGALNIPLRVTRQVLGWVQPADPLQFTADRFPVWVLDGNAGQGVHYGFPHTPDGFGGDGLKLALHWPGVDTDAATVERGPLPSDSEGIEDALERFLPSARGPLIAQRICLYTNTPDGHFIVDHHPEHPRVSLACGFSGHGFKFASVLGEVLADLAAGGKTDWPISFLGLSRFAQS